jgi:hypothetical protein
MSDNTVGQGNWNFTRQRGRSDSSYATGKWAVAMCDRCGWKKPWRTLMTEPGTNWKVCSDCNDYGYSVVAHPQNYSADVKDAIALRWARADQEKFADISYVLGDDFYAIAFNNGEVGLGSQSNNSSNGPYYLATEDGYVLTWDQNYIIQTGTSAASGVTTWPNQLNWQSAPFGYED